MVDALLLTRLIFVCGNIGLPVMLPYGIVLAKKSVFGCDVPVRCYLVVLNGVILNGIFGGLGGTRIPTFRHVKSAH